MLGPPFREKDADCLLRANYTFSRDCQFKEKNQKGSTENSFEFNIAHKKCWINELTNAPIGAWQCEFPPPLL